MKVKICGLCHLQDAERALELGAWALGFVSFPKSPRHMENEEISKICAKLSNSVKKVAVMVNPGDAGIENILKSGVNTLQLHGNESPERCAEIRKNYGVEVFKALRLRVKKDLEQIHDYAPLVEAFVLESAGEGEWGGSGRTGDWILAAEAVSLSSKPVVLSGGLKVENVAEAIRSVRPFAVDVSSGLELRPRIKDPIRMNNFFEEAMR